MNKTYNVSNEKDISGLEFELQKTRLSLEKEKTEQISIKGVKINS